MIHRRKPLVLFGYALAGAARPFVALATHPWHVLAVRVTDRVGKGIRSSPRDALIADAAGDRAGRAFGFHQAMDNVGAVFGPLLATGLLAAHLSLRAVFWVAVVPGIVAVAPRRGRARARPDSRAAARDAVPAEPRERAPSPLAHPRVATYLGILAVFSLGNSSDVFLLLRARALGLGTAQIPILWAVLNLSKVAWAYVGGDLADRVPRPRLIAAGWVVFALVYAGLGVARAPWEVWVLFVLYGIFYGLTEPVEKALVKDLVRAEQRGSAYGAYNFVVGVTALPAGLLAGALWRGLGAGVALGLDAALAVVAAFLLLGWDATWLRPDRPRRRT